MPTFPDDPKIELTDDHGDTLAIESSAGRLYPYVVERRDFETRVMSEQVSLTRDQVGRLRDFLSDWLGDSQSVTTETEDETDTTTTVHVSLSGSAGALAAFIEQARKPTLIDFNS